MNVRTLTLSALLAFPMFACGGQDELASNADAITAAKAGDGEGEADECECDDSGDMAACLIAYEDHPLVQGKFANGDPKTDPGVKAVRKVTCGKHYFWFEAQDGKGGWHLITGITTGLESTGVTDFGDGAGGRIVTYK